MTESIQVISSLLMAIAAIAMALAARAKAGSGGGAVEVQVVHLRPDSPDIHLTVPPPTVIHLTSPPQEVQVIHPPDQPVVRDKPPAMVEIWQNGSPYHYCPPGSTDIGEALATPGLSVHYPDGTIELGVQ